ncbi:response regulator [Cyclobacterium xiamenense]|nr:response regulator [Cyclobacterium xiamenense]
MKILLVDDDPIVILLQRKLMEKAGISHPVVPFNNGEAALDYLVEDGGKTEELLMFLDINMPGLSGWDVLDAVESLKFSQLLKVIIITSSIESSDKRRSEEYERIVDFWVKPFSIQDFTQLKDKFQL